MNILAVEESVKRHEGFSAKAYPDPVTGGEPYAWGFGFTYITRNEAEKLLRERLIERAKELYVKIDCFITLPPPVQEVLLEMSYQLGVKGLLGFEGMLKAIEEKRYDDAALEIKKSLLYEQTPQRARDYMLKMAEGAIQDGFS